MSGLPALSSFIRFGMHPRSVALSIALALAPGTGFAAPPLTTEQRAALLGSGVVGGAVVAALSAQERVRVMVAFAVPETGSSAGGDELARTAMPGSIASTCEGIVGRLPRQDFTLTHQFGSVAVFAGWISSAGLVALVRDPLVRRIDLDAGGSGALDTAVPLVGLDTVQSMGFTGDGITVAMLDSGIDLDHPDLVNSVAGQHCVCTNCCPDGSSVQTGPGSAEDDHGHGTNVGGIITSDGGVAPLGGAPDAEIVVVKVLDNNNLFCCTSDVVAGLQWIIDQRPDVDVVNMSLGTSALYAGDCDLADANTMAFAGAINTLRSLGVVVLAATQNNTSGTSMSAPACVANAVAVAASNDADGIYLPSNSNAQTNLFAPGVGILSTGPSSGTLTLTGTSQATALASACAAALWQAAPSSSPDHIESSLVTSPTTILDPKNGLSFPRLDCAAALVAVAIRPPHLPALGPAGIALLAGLVGLVGWRRLSS